MTISDQIALLSTEAEKLDSKLNWINLATIFLGFLTLVAAIGSYVLTSQLSENKAKQDQLKDELTKPRKLTTIQETTLFNVLNTGAKDSLFIYNAVLDDESEAYRTQLLDVIIRSGWDTSRHGSLGAGKTGVRIGIRDPKKIKPAHQVLLKAFQDAKIPFIYETGDTAWHDEFYIMFGAKPKLQ